MRLKLLGVYSSVYFTKTTIATAMTRTLRSLAGCIACVISFNFPAVPWKNYYYFHLHFIDGETEAWGGVRLCLRSHSKMLELIGTQVVWIRSPTPYCTAVLRCALVEATPLKEWWKDTMVGRGSFYDCATLRRSQCEGLGRGQVPLSEGLWSPILCSPVWADVTKVELSEEAQQFNL